jgi:hypothetical protein
MMTVAGIAGVMTVAGIAGVMGWTADGSRRPSSGSGMGRRAH